MNKEDLIKKYTHKLERHKTKEDLYSSRKDNLSKHGYWTLGYYSGTTSILEDILDDLESL